jgi:hypothetical protein
MKTYLLATAAIVSLAVAGAAQAQSVGHIGANYAANTVKVSGFDDEDADSYQVEGSVAFTGDGPFRGGLDASYTKFDADGLGSSVVGVTGHIAERSGQLGAFVGVENNENATLWGVGLEGKKSGDAGSFYLQLGYGHADDLEGVNFYAARAEGRFFMSDNLRAGLNGGYVKADSDFGDLDMWNLGADLEYQLPAAPVSLIAAYEHSNMSDLDLTSNTFRVGARYVFGGSLRDRDRTQEGQGHVGRLFGGDLGSAILSIAGEIFD